MNETNHEQTSKSDKFKLRGLEFLRRIEYRKLQEGPELEEVFKLRYEAYRREGLIKADALEKSSDEYDKSINAQNFALYFDGELASSIRIHYANSQFRTCPTNSHFPGVLEPYFDNGISFIDSSRFCTSLGMASKIPHLPLFTTRLTAMACLFFEADFMLSVVRPEHSAFYKRFFMMSRWATGQKVDWFAETVDLYASRYQAIEEGVLNRLPFFRSMESERQALFGHASQGKVVHVSPSAEEAIEIFENKTKSHSHH